MERFYLVVVQYAARLSSQKISAAVMRMMKRSSRGRCNLQVAPEEVSDSFRQFRMVSFGICRGLSVVGCGSICCLSLVCHTSMVVHTKHPLPSRPVQVLPR